VQNSGALLANSEADRDRVHAAARRYADLAIEATGSNLHGTIERLYSTVAGELNSAYIAARDSEARVFAELLRACLTSRSAEDVWRRSIRLCSDFAAASAAQVFLRQPSSNAFVLIARTLESGSSSQPINRILRAAEVRNLSKPFAATRKSLLSRYILDPRWRVQWPSCWSVPVLASGELGGIVQLAFDNRRPLLARDRSTLSTVAAYSLLAAQQAERVASIAAREQALAVTARRVLQIEELERRRVSRELHDDAGQSLVVIRLQMELLEQALPPNLSEIRQQLGEIREITEHTISSVRRLISDLSPAVLEQFGLAAGVRQLTKRFRQAYPCRLQVSIGKLPDVGNDFGILVYRVLQECLTNIARHSHAENVKISLTEADKTLRVIVQDDGVGLDLNRAENKPHRLGLAGMRERIALAGGSLAINSVPKTGSAADGEKTRGTKIKINLPIPTIPVDRPRGL
jgi:signal transduction histidine kinase